MTDKMYAAKLRSQRRKDTMYKRKKKKEDSMYRYYSRSKYRIGEDCRHELRAYNIMSKMWASPDVTQLMREAIDDYHDELMEGKLIVDEFGNHSINTPEGKKYLEFFNGIKNEFSFVYACLHEAAVKYGADAFLLEEFQDTMTSFNEKAANGNIDGMSNFLYYLETDLYDMTYRLFIRRMREFESQWLKVPTALFRYNDFVC